MTLRSIWPSLWFRRLPGDRSSGLLWWTWCALSLLLVVLAPTQLWDDMPFRTMPIRALSQALLAAAAFLALVVWIETRAASEKGASFVAALMAAAVVYAAAYLVFTYVRPDMAHSRGQFFLSMALGIGLAFLPHVLASTLRLLRVAALAAGVAAVVLLGFRSTLTGAPTREMIATALKPVAKHVYHSLVPPVTRVRGGAIEPYGQSFLLVTTDGDFYVIDWRAPGGPPVSRKLPLSLPPDPMTAEQERKRPAKDHLGDHRVLDLKIDTATTPPTVFVSTQEFDQVKACFTLRVSVATLDESRPSLPNPADAWTRIFESSPCVPASRAEFKYLESGGRLAFLQDKLLFTIGDFGMGHVVQPPPSQSADSAYGKVMLLGRSGGHEVFTTGHRNPQGLLVTPEGRIWVTEHGPQGGDEINLLERGRNYGWPLATYGTEYGRYYWPSAPGQHDHGAFAEPVHAFVPSIAISNLIRVESNAFPEWKHDLLIGSLNTATLYRARVRDDRVVYVEPIPVRLRIRDLAEGADGRIMLWTDAGNVAVLSPGPTEPIGSVVFARCRLCHESPPGPESLGPSIRGIVGADVARGSGYRYSPALSKLGGRWTEERLDAFLKNPDAFAPGSLMAAGQVSDDKERRAVIQFLKTYK